MVDTLTPLPSPPARTSQSNAAFVAAMDAWLAAQVTFQTEFNTSIGQINDLASGMFTGTSTSSNSIAGSGTKNFTTQTGLAFNTGQWVIAARTAAPTNYMRGQVSTYDSSTGALAITVAASGGSGTYIDWSIGLIPDPATLASYALVADVPELARDALGTALVAGTGVGITVNDGSDTITIASNGAPLTGSQSGGYTFVLGDANQVVPISSGNVTIPANGTVPFPVGTVIGIHNLNSSSMTVAITSDTLTQAGTGSTGTRTIIGYGFAALHKVSSTEWRIIGGDVS